VLTPRSTRFIDKMQKILPPGNQIPLNMGAVQRERNLQGFLVPGTEVVAHATEPGERGAETVGKISMKATTGGKKRRASSFSETQCGA